MTRTRAARLLRARAHRAILARRLAGFRRRIASEGVASVLPDIADAADESDPGAIRLLITLTRSIRST